MPRIWSVGHSTRSAEELAELLRSFGVRGLVDVRAFPASRRVPQFNREALRAFLLSENIRYEHIPELGGRRRPRPDSPNAGWRNASFRGYADHMGSGEFETGIRRLKDLAAETPTAFMCSEAVPWRCHRSLIADRLHADGLEVLHIISKERAHPHIPTPFLAVKNGKLTYPPYDEGNALF